MATPATAFGRAPSTVLNHNCPVFGRLIPWLFEEVVEEMSERDWTGFGAAASDLWSVA
jgi:hypothetical protein